LAARSRGDQVEGDGNLDVLDESRSATEPSSATQTLPPSTADTDTDDALLPVVPTSGRQTVWGVRPESGAIPRRRYPVRMLGLVAFSYSVDTLLLGLFAAAGTVSLGLPLVYGGVALAVCSTFFALLRSGLSARTRDANLTPAQMAAAAALQLACMIYAPNLAFFFLNVLFIIFAFGALRLTVRQSLIAVLIVSAATASLLYGTWERLDIPHATRFEAFLVWLCYASTLARCMYVGLYGSALRVKLHMRNVELADSSAKIERLASYDELTDTLNRRMMWVLLEDQLSRTEATHEIFCVALFDLDHFKSINDRFGHGVGDAVLQEFAATVRGSLRATDRIARHGGEEFLIFLTGTPTGEAVAALERVRQAVELRDWESIQQGLAVTVSGGIAAVRTGESVTDLVRRADAALYEAKRRGRNRVVLAG
jgi:diguanylate cyclase